MLYQTLLLSLLSTALSAPLNAEPRTFDTSIRVNLANVANVRAQNQFVDGQRDERIPAIRGPFATVELKLGKDVANKAYRCQILDENHKPIVVIRGANTDITFADGGNGPWTFRTPSLVSRTICDPAFKKIEAGASEVRVILQNLATDLGSQTTFADVKTNIKSGPTGSNGPYTSVELKVGPLAKQDLRCQILDVQGKAITVKRGQNVDTTFADGGNGPWQFLLPNQSEVATIVCDTTFKKAA